MEKVIRKQVGGDHYEQLSIQPIVMYEVFKLDSFQGPILKYLSRHKNKLGIQDLLKAIDYCNIAINQDHTPLVRWVKVTVKNSLMFSEYCHHINKLNKVDISSEYMNISILSLIIGDWQTCKENIKLYIYSEYDIDIDNV